MEGGFRGRTEFVNPSGGRLLGRRVYRSIGELPRPVDLAVLAVPAEAVRDVVTDLGRRRIPAAIVIAAGFGESGLMGVQRELELKRVAKAAHVHLLGPNCLGIVNPGLRFNASFAGPMPKPGGVAVVSQSGAMAVAIADWARARRLGISTMVSLGNEVDRDAAWAVEQLGADPRTTAVVLYLENLRNPRAFIDAARGVRRRVRIFAVLAGATNAGAVAAVSHTGHLATTAALTAAALRDGGVVVTGSLEELFRVGELADRYPGRDPARVAIVTNAGGAGILAADAVAGSSLTLAQFSAKSRARLRPALPRELTVHNPLDLRGDAPPKRYGTAVSVLGRDPGVDALLLLGTPQVVTHPLAAANTMVTAARRLRTVVVASFLGGSQVASARERLTRGGIPNTAYPEYAVAALNALHRSFELRRGLPKSLPGLPRAVRRIRGPVLLGIEAQRALSSTGIPFAESRFLGSGAKRIPAISLPAVAKIIHPSRIHKTDVGGVLLDLHTRAEVLRAVRTLRKLLPDARGGVLLQEQRVGVEVHVGALWHPHLGPVLAFGSGGVGVERTRDTTFIVLPARPSEIARRLAEHPVAGLLSGFRGSRGSVPALLRVLNRLATFLIHHPEVSEVDLNPVMVSPRGAVAVDARILVS